MAEKENKGQVEEQAYEIVCGNYYDRKCCSTDETCRKIVHVLADGTIIPTTECCA
jgi:hypothetical protein